MLLRLFRLILIYDKLAGRCINAQNIAEDAEQLNLVSLICVLLRQHSKSHANTSTALPSSASADYLDFTGEHPLITYNSAVAMFYVPSDLSGAGGMRKEQIRAVSCWRGGCPQLNTMLLKPNNKYASKPPYNDEPTVNSFSVASFEYNHASYECALVHDYQVVKPNLDEITGMAIVKRAMRGGQPRAYVIPLNDILQAVHLIPVFSKLGTSKRIPKKYKHKLTLDDRQLFKLFYVNRFVDHHAFEILL